MSNSFLLYTYAFGSTVFITAVLGWEIGIINAVLLMLLLHMTVWNKSK